MKNQNLYTITLIFIFTVLQACSDSKPNSENATKEEPNTVEISAAQFSDSQMKLGQVTSKEMNEVVKTNGFVDVPPANKAIVSAIMGGYIKSTPLLIGDKVKKGQLLLTLENPDYIEIQQQYLEVFQQLNYLKSEYERQKTLFNEKITSEKNYFKAESNYKTALATVNGLANKLSLMHINLEQVKAGNFTSVIAVYAPINGSITAVYALVGKFMNASEPLVQIVNNTQKHLELVVFEKDVLKVKDGQTILFRLPEDSNNSYLGEVHLIGTSIDEKNRTVKVHGHIKDERESFLPGMFVEAEIVTNKVKKEVLPINAVLGQNDTNYILVLSNKTPDSYTFLKTSVQTGATYDDFIEIMNAKDLQSKDILVSGTFLQQE